MDILRISTAGSVDDGKSTLIGRLLYDTRSITGDKLDAIKTTSKRKGLDFMDLSLLTDGLIAEREQGITIDVAHIYFSTAARKYIIADSPGHVEYTRNMITGASNVSVSLILIDARKGVIEQTKRHFYIASMLRIKQVIVCVNKMDLVDFQKEIFDLIRKDFEELRQKAGFKGQQVGYLPVSAKRGDNIVEQSNSMPWYQGETLLGYLENISISADRKRAPARFPVQYVIRPHSDAFHDFRGYAGKVESGFFETGDEVMVLPSRKITSIRSIHEYKKEKQSAAARESVVISLQDNVDLSRGNMIVKKESVPDPRSIIKATVCWMDESMMKAGQTYLLQHGVQRVKTKISRLNEVLDIHTMDTLEGKNTLQLNDIGEIELKLAQPIFADNYDENPDNGSFILIDEFTNNTVAVGFVRSN